nr:MAG TPA: hypothetical protein [Caudoviricetes sp.]
MPVFSHSLPLFLPRVWQESWQVFVYFGHKSGTSKKSFEP